MFNFDTTFTKGKQSFEIVDNEIVLENGFSAVAGNALIRHWLDKVIIPQVNKKIPSANFDTLVKEINYLMAGLGKVKSIKQRNCSYNNKSLELIEIEVETIKDDFCSKIPESNFSQAQNLILKSLSHRSTSISSCEIQELYNPVTDDDSKLQKWWKELNSFNYKKYGVDKTSVLTGITNYSGNYNGNYYGSSARSSFNTVTLRIESFRALVAEAGDDLINWSDHKISRRGTKAWELSEYTGKYCEHLKKKGIKKADKKKTSKGKLKDIIVNGEPTQDEFFRYYKQASGLDATGVIKELDLEHLYLIIDSTLKCVTSKLECRWGGRGGDDFNIVVQQLCEKSVTKQDYQKIIKWATPKHVNEAFMVKHKDHTSVTKVKEYCETANISTSMFIDDEFYHTCLDKIPANVKYTLNKGLTYQYMVRMNDSEKIKILKEIANGGIDISYDTLHGLYSKVNYNLIKDTILKDHSLIESMCGIVINNNDHASMIKCSELGNSLETQHKVGIFDKLTFEEKKVVVINNKSDNAFTGGIKTLDDTECLNLLADLIKSEHDVGSYITAIFERITRSALPQANKIVATIADPNYIPFDESVIKKLSVATKIVLLNNGIDLKEDTSYYSYSRQAPKTPLSLGKNFFSDFRRQDIDKVYQNPMHCEYSKFLAHTMTKAELEQCVDSEINYWNKNTHNLDLQQSFLRHNIDLLSYGYVKQFKEKESFRIVVGDRRDRANKAFGIDLLAKMNVSQSIDFMFT